MNKTLDLKEILVVLLLVALATPAAFAKKTGAPSCGATQASTSIYSMPHIKDHCPSPKICQKFKDEVRMQGYGTLSDGSLLDYRGKITNDECKNGRGAKGDCLIPFLSVAADPSYYRIGDIIKMPGLKGQELKLPDGKMMTHPGYVIVQDVGSAIKGANRFDFFVGTYHKFTVASKKKADTLYSPDNRFGIGGDLSLADKKACDPNSDLKKFSVIRRSKGSTYQNALASIKDAQQGRGGADPAVRMASAKTNGVH